MRRTILIFLVMVSGAVVYCFWGKQVQTYQDGTVTAGEIRPPIGVIAVHVSWPNYLTVCGKTYSAVRGVTPYYIKVPELNSILFVTGKENQESVIHLVNLGTKVGTQFDTGSSSFGRTFGFKGAPGSLPEEYVEKVLSNRITVVSQSFGWKEAMVLNLTTKSAEHRRTLISESQGAFQDHPAGTNLSPVRK